MPFSSTASSSLAASTFRALSHLAQSSPRRCPQCLRNFSSYKPYQTSAKRKLQTASTIRPQSFEPPPPPPRNTFSPSAPITRDTGSKADAQTIVAEDNAAVQQPATAEKVDPPAQPQSTTQVPTPANPSTSTEPKKAPRQFKFTPRKATIKLSPAAVEHVRMLLDQPEPKLLRIGTKNKGCSGLAYNLEYVDKPGKFDETVEQDGVKVLIESRTLLHIIGSEMDWVEDKLSARFVFKNPNITEQCGCGESFSIS